MSRKKIFLAFLLLLPADLADGVSFNFTPDHRATEARALEERELLEIAAADRSAIENMRAGRPADIAAVEARYLGFLRRHPRNAEARNFLGGFYYDTGRAFEARGQWLAGLRAAPRNAYLYNNLAEYYAHDAGRPRRAIELTRRAISLKDDVAVFHLNLATYYDVFRYAVLSDYGNEEMVFQKVLAAYRRAMRLEPDDYGHAFDYARTLTFSPSIWRIEDPVPTAEKIAAWERCLEIAPDENAASLARDQLERLRKKARNGN